MKQERSWYEVVLECQERIVRIRAVLTTGGVLTQALQDDLNAVILAVRKWIYGRARRFGLDEDGCSDVLLEFIRQLHRNVCSPGFTSMERAFGAYVSTTVNRILFERKNKQQNSLSSVESLDAPVTDDGLLLHEIIEDPTMERLVEAHHDEQIRKQLHEAIATLPSIEHFVITQRLHGARGTDIAHMLGISDVSVSRIYHRAVKRLRQVMTTGEAS